MGNMRSMIWQLVCFPPRFLDNSIAAFVLLLSIHLIVESARAVVLSHLFLLAERAERLQLTQLKRFLLLLLGFWIEEAEPIILPVSVIATAMVRKSSTLFDQRNYET